ncbi:TPA: NAD-dependent epimerase/dehydratase family protein, partial [Candidatus Poribacteria bacterium]|nr:NAD-dependent epimerase/dehydratase family protein [Candidatus Poribacteria bacterium]
MLWNLHGAFSKFFETSKEFSVVNNRICVIGGSGFIGTRLCKRFEGAGGEFFIVDKRQSHTFPHKTRIADVRDVDALRRVIQGDVIINLAAE